jgi:hypothetical protein
LGPPATIDSMDPRAPSTTAPPSPDLLHVAPTSHLPDEVGQRGGACLNSSTRHDGPDAINYLHKMSAKGTCLQATTPANREAPQRLQGLRQLPKRSNPTPQSMGARVTHPLKPTNSLELGREQLSSGPNEGPRLRLGMLPTPWSIAVEGQSHKAYSRGPGPATVALRKGMVLRMIRWPRARA